MQLRHLSIPHLIAEAHGDPWAVNQSLQSGRPAQISDLAKALHGAAQSSNDANAAFEEALRRFEAAWNHENGDHPINDSAEVQRVTQSLHVQAAQLPKIAIDLENISAALAGAQRSGTGQITIWRVGCRRSTTSWERRSLLSRTSTSPPVIGPTSRMRFPEFNRSPSVAPRTPLASSTQSARGYSDKLQTSLTTLRTEGYDPELIQTLEAPSTPSKAEPEANRQQNQIDAFTKEFGRPPNSAADWETAAALDRHSYDPKNQGERPNIVVKRIDPVPGQGVVRTNLFIPGHSVVDPQIEWPPYHNNLGDDRGFSATADPESSRVSITVDYENGILVARQNPSVDEKTGQVRVGTPTVSAVQKRDGSVLVNYSAADPFSPGGEGLAKLTTLDVNGAIAIEPTADGPRVGGRVTNFPAVEIYSDRAGATTPLVQSWPHFESGRLGPEAGLWWHKPIGDPAVLASFGDQRPSIEIPSFPFPIPLPGPLPIPIPIPLPIPIRIPFP